MINFAASNQVVLSGQLNERKPMRFTPAGISVSEALVVHASEQFEAGKLRQVACEISVIGLGESARWLEAVPLGATVKLTGFMAAKRQHSKSLVLHIQKIEFLEGIENGSLLQKEG